MVTYYNVKANLFGEDRQEAMAVMDNDVAFDKWMRDYERKKMKESGGNQRSNRVPVGKEEFLSRMGTSYGEGDFEVDG